MRRLFKGLKTNTKFHGINNAETAAFSATDIFLYSIFILIIPQTKGLINFGILFLSLFQTLFLDEKMCVTLLYANTIDTHSQKKIL